MRDVVYVAITVGFFALAALFVVGCARIVGSDDAALGYDEHGDDLAGADSRVDPIGVSR